jgi:ABC-type polysaccharide/polyol phosphate transport system ATPase subunit
MTPAISVHEVSKRYRLYHERNQSLKATVLRGRRAKYEEFWALRDVSLEVPQASTFALIGENGSGKTTLLKCMAKILRPDGGTLETRGKISALLELGAGFHPELSGRDNVYLNGSILGLSKKEIRRRFDDIVAFAGLEHFIDSPVKNYSSGMYVRLGFSVAINVDPDILLVDEVLAVGDIEFQRRCIEKLVELKARGKTIVIVSHSLDSVRNLCDAAALLEGGKLRRVGPATAVIDEYIGDTLPDRVADGEFGARWGSGEGAIDRIELLDADGSPSRRVRTGDPVTFRLHYSTRRPIEEPVFGLALHHIDGVYLCGPNTRDAGLVPDRVDGSGVVDLRVDRMLLLPGTYDVGATLCDPTLSHVYDQRHRAFRFDVEHGEPREEFGLVSLGGVWEGTVLGQPFPASERRSAS